MTRAITIRRDPIAAGQGLPSWVAQCVAPDGANVTMAFRTQAEAMDAAPGLLAELRAPVAAVEPMRGWAL